MSSSIVVGLGGNVGSEDAIVDRFRRAREALEVIGRVRSAPLYRTAPVGPPQPAFANTAVRLPYAGEPEELIATLLELEHLLGRDRRGEDRWGPRAIDLDVLVWDGRTIHTPRLEVPHPRLHERRFALAPLVALAGEAYDVPGHGPAGALLARVLDQPLELVSETW